LAILELKKMQSHQTRLGEKIGLILALGAALLLAGLVVTATIHAAPPDQAPDQTPSGLRGEALWAENCAPCHGVSGRGDGPTAQMAQMADNPPTDFTDQVAAQQRILADMFTVTKEGRMDRLMPPWGGRLGDSQIWDVVAYAQTFAMSPDDIAAGQAIYEAKCAVCHAADGTGSIPGAPDFSDAAAMVTKSPQALFDVVSQGQGEMPAFADQLSQGERWQVVDYVRTFGYEPIVQEGAIAGQIQNVTTGQPLGDVEVRLRRWQTETELSPLIVQADADGSFRFDGLDTQSQAFYRAEVVHDGVPFPSDFVSFEPGVTQVSLPVGVYETTTSDEDISVERFHFIVIGDQPGFFSVLELYQFSNLGDRAYVGVVNEDGLRETVRMALPEEAQELALQNGIIGVDFLETDEGLVATAPVIPGVESFEVAFVYAVPYGGADLSLDRAMYYDSASVNGLLMDVGANLESDILAFDGERSAQGQTFLQYTAQNLPAGETLPIHLVDLDKIEFATTSEPAGATTVMPSTLNQKALLWMMLGLGALSIVFGLAYPLLRLRFAGEAPASESDLMQERQRLLLTLARLDQAYKAGELNETVYRRARERHKVELADLMRRMEDRGL
jgi:mono/diheme cytochrome c family protein